MGIEELASTLREFKDKLSDIDSRMQGLGQNVEYSETEYMGRVESYVLENYYDETKTPIPPDVYGELFAAKMTDEDIERIMARDLTVLPAIAKRVEKALKGVTSTKQVSKEAGHVLSLPKVPGKGGSPSPGPEEKPVTGRDLHKKAGEALQSILSRNAKG